MKKQCLALFSLPFTILVSALLLFGCKQTDYVTIAPASAPITIGSQSHFPSLATNESSRENDGISPGLNFSNEVDNAVEALIGNMLSASSNGFSRTAMTNILAEFNTNIATASQKYVLTEPSLRIPVESLGSEQNVKFIEVFTNVLSDALRNLSVNILSNSYIQGNVLQLTLAKTAQEFSEKVTENLSKITVSSPPNLAGAVQIYNQTGPQAQPPSFQLKTIFTNIVVNLQSNIVRELRQALPESEAAALGQSLSSNLLAEAGFILKPDSQGNSFSQMLWAILKFIGSAGVVGALCAWAIDSNKNEAFANWLKEFEKKWCACDDKQTNSSNQSVPATTQQETKSEAQRKCERCCFVKRSFLSFFYELLTRCLVGIAAASLGPMLCGLINSNILAEAKTDTIKFLTMFGISVIAAFSGQKFILPVAEAIQRQTIEKLSQELEQSDDPNKNQS